MKARADAVADQLPHHRVPRPFGDLLHRVPDVADVVSGAGLRYARLERVFRDAEQAFGFGTHLGDGKGRRGIGVQPFQPDADVDAEQVPVMEVALVGRDAVHDFLIDRRAQRGGKIIQPLERRAGTRMAADEVFGDAVELGRRDAGGDFALHDGQGRRHDAAGGRHRLDLARRLDRDHRPMVRLISSAICSTVPVPGTRCTMPRCA